MRKLVGFALASAVGVITLIGVIKPDGTVVSFLNDVSNEGDRRLDNVRITMGHEITNRIGKGLYNTYVSSK